MKPNFLAYAGGVGVIVGTLLWSTVTQAQGFCYLVDSEGQVVNLDTLCENDREPVPEQPQEAVDSDIGDALVETQASPTPEVRSYTIIGPVVGPESDAPAGEAAPDAQTTAADPTEPASPSDSMDESNRSGLPGSEASTTEIRVLQTPDSTTTVIDRPDREVNGVIIRGRNQTIVGPPSLEPGDQSAPSTPEPEG